MVWGPISLIGFFCTLVFLGFAILSLLLIFSKRGTFMQSVGSLLLSCAFFAVFVFGAVKVQQDIEKSSHKLDAHATHATQVAKMQLEAKK
ncbi:hypothetical protein DFP93_104205 [Aneurinibacillus soli]|uniref:Uncharacterized protein n=1 Tax=Aneurinibacillus soli TaxID=1500254 RepID=A0A0U5B853_9BACL|nr:hypothetical protein [Aneurinibacillus soli]PYE62554.1 hypothetical protein DFP93_104205 [Aneurinibacillus soli]BAU27116.1 hypothetical protein CB4_01285 [Aneurinibacillus soli]